MNNWTKNPDKMEEMKIETGLTNGLHFIGGLQFFAQNEVSRAGQEMA